jgi:FkbM family methyltransferase
MKPIKTILGYLRKIQGHVFIIQIGSYSGNTFNDPVYNFIRKHTHLIKDPKCSAILIEPVKHIFTKLINTYKGCNGLVFENLAIADTAGLHNFYRLKEGIKINEGQGWFYQLGSLLPERMGELWDKYEKDDVAKEFITKHTVVEEVQCITFNNLIENHKIKEIDFLQIDAEGYDFDIIRTIDFKIIKPKIINYERVLLQDKEAKCRELLKENSYILYDHGQDTLCITNSLKFLPLMIILSFNDLGFFISFLQQRFPKVYSLLKNLKNKFLT